MSRQTYTVTTRVRIEQTFEVQAGCAQDAAEAAELYVARELTGVDILIDEPVRPVGKQISPVAVSTEEKALEEVPVPVPLRLRPSLLALAKRQLDEPDEYLPDGPRGSL